MHSDYAKPEIVQSYTIPCLANAFFSAGLDTGANNNECLDDCGDDSATLDSG